MEETEQPKTPHRRRSATVVDEGTAAEGATPAKLVRRRAAPKADTVETPPKLARAPAKPRTGSATTAQRTRARADTTDAAAPTASPSSASAARSRKPAAAKAVADGPAASTAASSASLDNQTASLGPAASSVSPEHVPLQREPDRPAPASALPTAPAHATQTHTREEPDTPATIPSFARKPEPPRRAALTARPADTSQRSGRVLDWLLDRVPQRHRSRVHDDLVLMRMDRPIGALLLLWPTWWALWFAANDFPPIGPLLIFTLGVFVMRAAGCVINDYADHGWLDAQVERTAGRPMAAGRVSKKEALTLFAGLLALAFVLVLFTNALTIQLSFVGAALAAIYPFTKRFTHLAQVVLGAAFGWSIPMAFAAVTNSLPPLCWLLFLANILFSTIYDTEYAMVDRDEDIRAGAKSTAILFGDADRVIIGVLMATFLLAMLLAGTRTHLAWPYFFGLAAAAGLFGYQQWLICARDRIACFAAFRHNNWVGLALWVGLAMALAVR